jgi:hypothetical protein
MRSNSLMFGTTETRQLETHGESAGNAADDPDWGGTFDATRLAMICMACYAWARGIMYAAQRAAALLWLQVRRRKKIRQSQERRHPNHRDRRMQGKVTLIPRAGY